VHSRAAVALYISIPIQYMGPGSDPPSDIPRLISIKLALSA